MDVEHRAQLVPVFGFKPARTEFNAVHHVGVGERQSLLLAAPHQEGAVHFDVVDVDQIFVERPAPHVVRAAQFRREVHRRLKQGVLDRASGGGDLARQLGVDALHRHVLPAVPDDLRLLEVGPRLQPEPVLRAFALERPGPRLRAVPDERRLDGPWARVGEFDAVPPFRVGGHPKPEVVLHQDGRAREGCALGVLDVAGQEKALGPGAGRGRQGKPASEEDATAVGHHCLRKSPDFNAWRNCAQATGFSKFTGGACPA